MGKTGISDHRWSSDNQKARIYRTELIGTRRKEQPGHALRVFERLCLHAADGATRIS